MYRSLLAAALVPLALGDYSYDYNVPTMAPTTETAQPTLEVCPVLVGLTEEDCPGGEINYTIPACNSTGLVPEQFCWGIVEGTPDQPPTCDDEPPTDCEYTGPPFDDTQRRRLSISSGPGGFKAVGNNPTTAKPESYSYTYKEAPTAAPTTETARPTLPDVPDGYIPDTNPASYGVGKCAAADVDEAVHLEAVI